MRTLNKDVQQFLIFICSFLLIENVRHSTTVMADQIGANHCVHFRKPVCVKACSFTKHFGSAYAQAVGLKGTIFFALPFTETLRVYLTVEEP